MTKKKAEKAEGQELDPVAEAHHEQPVAQATPDTQRDLALAAALAVALEKGQLFCTDCGNRRIDAGPFEDESVAPTYVPEEK